MDLGHYFANVLPARLKDGQHGLSHTFVFDVSGADGGVWSIDFRDGTVHTGPAPADCTLGLSSADLRELLGHPERSGSLYLRGHIRVTGNDAAALRFLQYLGMSHG